MVDPMVLCRKHLLGEHVECHMFRGSLKRGKSLRGFLDAGLLDSRQLARRHDALAKEMMRRNYHHESPLPRDFDARAAISDVNSDASMRELAARCEECRERQSNVRKEPRLRSRDSDRSRQ